MKKLSIYAVFAAVCCATARVADAAYPVYPAYSANNTQGQMIYLPSATNGTVVANSAVAASPTRITGTLPRVGSNVTAAGRQYYQAADYDRLADSGLYIGLSVGYSASIIGSIQADYTGDSQAYLVPGAFKSANFSSDTVIPLQISMGAAINNDVRADFSFTRYSGLAYPDSVQTADGVGGYVGTNNSGGAITSNVTMLNVYYNIDSYTGYLAGGMLRPYVGVGVGMALNTIADYVVADNSFYSVSDPVNTPAGEPTAISDVLAYHNGGTTEQFAFMLEGGVTTELDGGLKLDFFVRYANLGNVKTSGSIIVSQTEWLSDGTGTSTGEFVSDYSESYHYTDWTESGRLGLVDIGMRLRLQF